MTRAELIEIRRCLYFSAKDLFVNHYAGPLAELVEEVACVRALDLELGNPLGVLPTWAPNGSCENAPEAFE